MNSKMFALWAMSWGLEYKRKYISLFSILRSITGHMEMKWKHRRVSKGLIVRGYLIWVLKDTQESSSRQNIIRATRKNIFLMLYEFRNERKYF